MSHSYRSTWSRYRLSAIGAGLAATAELPAAADFHLTFGTTGNPNDRNADTAELVVETQRGDLVVAGTGASRWSDDGVGDHTVPLIARIGAGGELEWQRVLHELANQRIAALMSAGEEQYVVLTESSRAEPLVQHVTLRRIDRSGSYSDIIGALDASWVVKTLPVADADPPYFLLAAKRGATPKQMALADVQLFQLDLQGRVNELSVRPGIRSVSDWLHLGQQDFLLFPVWQLSALAVDDPATRQFRSDAARLSLASGAEMSLTLVNQQCHPVAAHKDRIICVDYAPIRADQINGAVVSYSLGGQARWRHEVGARLTVQQLLALDSGEVVYGLRDLEGTRVVGLDPTGRRAWRQTVRSAGEHTLLYAIESLRNGRLAFVGSTGPWNGFVSTDTSAMLIVVDAFGDDLSTPPLAVALDRAQ